MGCSGTVIPQSVPTEELKKNHYALVDGDTIFDTVGGGEVFTTTDTAGCSCEQSTLAAARASTAARSATCAGGSGW